MDRSTNWIAADDEELLAAHARGIDSAFEALYQRYRVPLYAYLRRRVGAARAEDLFVSLWLEVADSEPPDADTPFVARLFQRAYARSEDAGESIEHLDPRADATLRTRGKADRYERALGALPRIAREAYLLYEDGGLAIAEVAQILKLEPSAARDRLGEAVAGLRQGLGEVVPLSASLHDPKVAVAHFAARPPPPPVVDGAVIEHARRGAEARRQQHLARRRLRGVGRKAAWLALAAGLLGGFYYVIDPDDSGTPSTRPPTYGPLRHAIAPTVVTTPQRALPARRAPRARVVPLPEDVEVIESAPRPATRRPAGSREGVATRASGATAPAPPTAVVITMPAATTPAASPPAAPASTPPAPAPSPASTPAATPAPVPSTVPPAISSGAGSAPA